VDGKTRVDPKSRETWIRKKTFLARNMEGGEILDTKEANRPEQTNGVI